MMPQPSTMFTKNKRQKNELKETFGKIKDEYFDFDLIEKYFRKRNNTDAFQVLSDKTCNDLDVNELFMFVDRTNSKVGQQYLYKRLRTIPKNINSFELDESLIELFTSNEEYRVSIQKHLVQLQKDDVYYISSLFQEEHQKPPKWFWIARVLSVGSLISMIMLYFSPLFVLLLLPIIVVNIGVHYWNKKNLYQYLGSIPQLLKLQSVAKSIFKEKQLQNINPNLPDSLKIIDQIKNRMSFFQLEAKIQGDLEAAFWAILELIKTVFLLEPQLLFGVLKRLNTRRKHIENVFEFVGHIDSLISIASLRCSSDLTCVPTITQTNSEIVSDQIYHPLIKNCVRNNIQVDQNSVLITGSNMSGKTTFIRTIGINVLTGLTFNTCFAKAMLFPKLKLFSAIRISDDLMNDKSYYFEEVLTIKKMIQNSEDQLPNLFLLDELFKGTNTIERISAGKAILSCLAKNNNIVFVSTHDVEMTDMLAKEYDLYHFSEIVHEETIAFDFKLKQGRLKMRNAIRILEINDYPAELIEEALSISKELDVKTQYVIKDHSISGDIIEN